MFDNKVILITGGTGSFGKECTKTLLTQYKPKKVIIFSRDELKQFEMAQEFSDTQYPAIRYFIGDVRDKERLHRAFDGVDIVIHAAAMKQVPAAEYNPFEAVKTNILGAQNIIDTAIDQGVGRVLALSTDKACNPVNLYGATKLCSDKLFVAGNAYGSRAGTKFSVVRYGNVMGSRGSVIPFFKQIMENGCGTLPITDPRMTRFWITLESGIAFVLNCIERMVGEIFIPKLPSMNIMDLAKAVCPHGETKVVGIRPGEKIHEVMVSLDDARNTVEGDDHYVIKPSQFYNDKFDESAYTPVADDFEYDSGTNDHWLSIEELQSLLGMD